MSEQWQDIKTAPRDRPFLAYEGGDIYKAKFYHECEDGEVFYISYCGQRIVNEPEPTHWMEAPEEPHI